jgi:hypothetical protein
MRRLASSTAKTSWRLSGFTLQGSTSSDTIVRIAMDGVGQWSFGWRIDHVKFNYTGAVINDPLFISGVTYGLVDHCDWIIGSGGTFILQAGYNGSEDGTTIPKLLGAYNASQPLDLGTYKAIYIEDCTFSSNGSTNAVAAFDSSSGGARVVFRHNTSIGVVYAHWNRTGEIDGIKYEVYNNIMTGDSINQLPIRMEAGTGVIFNNTITGYSTAQIWIDERRGDGSETGSILLACDGTHTWDGNIEAGGWPCLGQIGRAPGSALGSQTSAPLYAWNNGPTSTCTTGGACTDSVELTPIGVGSTRPFGNYLKTTGSTHSNGDVDYVNGGNTPKAGYSSFVYPFPLDSNGLPLSAPPNSSVRGTCGSGMEWLCR